MEWGFEIWRTLEIQKHSKSGLFENEILDGLVFQGSGYGPDQLKPVFCPDFKCLFMRWRQFVLISDGHASGFQIPFKIQIMCKPTLMIIQNPDALGVSDALC